MHLKVRSLEQQNKLLEAEIEAYQNRFEKPSGLRLLYEEQLRELRRIAEQMRRQRVRWILQSTCYFPYYCLFLIAKKCTPQYISKNTGHKLDIKVTQLYNRLIPGRHIECPHLSSSMCYAQIAHTLIQCKRGSCTFFTKRCPSFKM